MGINPRTKGASGERELKTMFATLMAEVEQETGLPGLSHMVKRNTTQSDRGGDDLVGIPLISIEAKRQEALSLNTWFAQCVKSAQAQKLMPVLIYRQNRKPWKVVTYGALCHPEHPASMWAKIELDLEDFLTWYRSLYADWLRGKR